MTFYFLETIKIIKTYKGPQNRVKTVCSKKLNHALKNEPILTLKNSVC